MQHHDRSAAERELALAARDPAYAALARDTLRATTRDGAVVASTLAYAEVDTNPGLVPDTPPAGSLAGPPATDADGLIGGSLTVRPAHWLSLRDVVSYRAMATVQSLDFFAENAQLAGELVRGRVHAAVSYDFDFDMLGGSPFLIANVATLSLRREGATAAIAASYALHRRDYLADAQAGFVGWVHVGELGATLHATPWLDVDGYALVWRELTADPTFSDVTVGARFAARARLSPRVRVVGDTTAWYATYDVAEPDGSQRMDGHVEGELRLEVDLADTITATLGAGATYNDSTVDDFDYTRLLARLGLAVVLGAP
jgi:hypothetical protein